jgi:hypothetical protein
MKSAAVATSPWRLQTSIHSFARKEHYSTEVIHDNDKYYNIKE